MGRIEKCLLNTKIMNYKLGEGISIEELELRHEMTLMFGSEMLVEEEGKRGDDCSVCRCGETSPECC